MAKIFKHDTTMQRKRHLYLGLFASLLLGLSSCQKEDFDGVSPTPSVSAESSFSLAESIRRGNHIEVDLEAELDQSSDLMRSIRFELIQREGYPGRQLDAEDTYEREYRPTVKLSENDEVRGIVIIAKKGDNNSVHRQYVNFKTVKVTRDGEEKNILRYVGPISMPANYKINEGDEWYAMAMINFDLGLINNSLGTGQSIHGRIVERSDMTENRRNIGLSSVTPESGSEVYLRSVPFVSNWRPVKVEVAGHGRVLDFDFKPQGALVQYELGADVSDSQIIRRYGLASNVLDFSGYYDLSTQELQAGLGRSDADGWGGIPIWKADPSSMSTYNLQYRDLSQTGLSSADVSFPWHMPILNNSEQGVGVDESYGAQTISASEMSIKLIDVLPNSLVQNIKGFTMTMRSDGSGSLNWEGMKMSGNNENASPSKDRRILLFWGMPRATTIQDPQTYFFVDAHDQRDIFASDFDYSRFNILENLVYSYRRNIYDLETAGDISNARSHYNSYKPTIDQYRVDSAKFYGLMPHYTGQKTERTQNALVLHQTTARFKAGQISHIQTILKSDLLITEQVYVHDNGHNYSMIEVYNPTQRAVSLADYALVRLIDNGSYMAYRKPDGSWTDQLDEALILPLSFVNPDKSSPFEGSPFTSIGARGAYSNPRERYREVIRYGGGLTVGGSKGSSEQGKTISLNSVTDMQLASNQTAVLGASGYLQKDGDRYKYFGSNIESKWLGYVRYQVNSGSSSSPTYNCRYMLAYSDASTSDYQGGTLDFEHGEGFALLKSTGNGQWQVIDATAPIGIKGYGFPVKYDVYKRQFAGLPAGSSYSLQRFNGIDYPYIYPFRTASGLTEWPSRHWVFTANLEDGRTSSLGRRDVYVNTGYSSWASYFSTKRTPLDPGYTTYRQNIPAKM